MVGFAAGPILILYLVSHFGTDATPWLMIPGILLSVALFFALPQWKPHGRRPLRSLVDFSLVRGPVGLLALGGSFASVAFVTFTSSLPLSIVEEHGYDSDDPLIGMDPGHVRAYRCRRRLARRPACSAHRRVSRWSSRPV